ncbi:hypothetical protein ACGFW5_26580 [Streptomyces sp. NPDC048416]|uniref:hypothetical protein n=1 Tax=Streptomyces sp. NPDC048416 TaxID=3365546 RepID=UPI0037126DFF
MPAAIWTGRNATAEHAAVAIAAALADELGLAAPPLTVTMPAASTGTPAGSLLPPRARFSNMPAPTHCFLYVDTTSPRRFELRASLMAGRSGFRRSLGLGHLFYAVPMTAPVPSPLELSAPAGAAPAGFTGDPTATSRLNGDTHLIDAARALTPATAGPDRHHTWQATSRLTIEPLPEGSVLLVQTLHRLTARAWSLSAAEVLGFAAGVEALLG